MFSLALSWAIFSAFAEPEIDFARTTHLIWVALLFGTTALALYVWAVPRQPLSNYWRLAWTFALVLYLIHFSYGLFVMHKGDIGSVFAHQSTIIASFNLFLTAFWTFDVATAWLRPGKARAYQRLAAHVIVFLGFAIATLAFGSTTAKWLGSAMVLVLVAVVIARCMNFASNPQVAQ